MNMPTYAIISLGGKQHRVREGERLLVDRLPYGEGKTFHPDILFLGGDGEAELVPKGVQVTAKVVGHVLGEKIRIGKYKRRTGYKRHNGYRSRLSQIEIETIDKKVAPKPKAEAKAKAEAEAEAEKPTEKKPPARKPAAKKDEA
jgi:large subunit ribosomal protein L21